MEREFPGLRPDHEFRDVFEFVEGELVRRRTRRSWVTRSALSLAAAAVLAAGWMGWASVGPSIEPLRMHGSLLRPGSSFPDAQLATLSDDSQLRLEPGTQLSVETNTAEHFRTHLAAGRVAFDVKPSQARRRWSIVVGQVEVVVVGTQFAIEHRPPTVRVSVSRGEVKVSGPTVPGGTQTLGRGAVLEAALSADSGEREAGIPVRTDATMDAPGAEAASGAEEDAPELSASDFLQQADALRRRGQHRAAARLLSAALRQAPSGTERPLLAFTLGRIQLDNLGQPEAAARSFRLAVQLGLPPALREQALARSVQAWAAAGNYDRAATTARQYLQEYPQGPNRRLILQRLERIVAE